MEFNVVANVADAVARPLRSTTVEHVVIEQGVTHLI